MALRGKETPSPESDLCWAAAVHRASDRQGEMEAAAGAVSKAGSLMAAETTVLASAASAIGVAVAAGAAWWRVNARRNGQTGDGAEWRTQHEKECRERWEKLYHEVADMKAAISRIEGRLEGLHRGGDG